jgi:hypothetical protein
VLEAVEVRLGGIAQANTSAKPIRRVCRNALAGGQPAHGPRGTGGEIHRCGMAKETVQEHSMRAGRIRILEMGEDDILGEKAVEMNLFVGTGKTRSL